MTLLYKNHKVITIVPVFSELGKIGKVISKFNKEFSDEVCLVLDQPTKKIKNEILTATNNVDLPVKLIENDNRRGIGHAIRLGINYALKNKFDIIVVMAGNNKDDPSEIPKFLDQIVNNDCDYVQGSRFLIGGDHSRTPMLRILLIRLYSLLWSVCTRSLITDVTNGFRAYKTKIFNNDGINIWQSWLNGYELEFYINYKVKKLGFKTMEIPVSKVYPGKNESYTKIHPIKDFWSILRPLIYLHFKLRS